MNSRVHPRLQSAWSIRTISAVPSHWVVLLLLSAGGCFGHSSTGSSEGKQPSTDVLAKAEAASLERHYSEAIKILQKGLREHPDDAALQLELGRAYLATGAERKAERMFREILQREPSNREARLELARALSYQRDYAQSDGIYRALLSENPADESAAIGLTNNLVHEGKGIDAATVADAALVHHPNSLRLQEYKDRIASGILSGEERPLPAKENVFSAGANYVDDSAGNHS